jgi:ubiquinone/menaquinone biosynthesis C-methylase UbiE
MHLRIVTLASLLALVAGAACGGLAPVPPGAGDPHERRVYRFERQELTVPDIESSGYILDIGGGGAGVIGQIRPRQVIAIDISRRELEGAPAGPLKIVMDARELKFLDNTFPVATSFFTLMYIDESDHLKVFQEIRRVLAPGGRFLVWDVILPKKIEKDKDIAAFPFLFHLPGGKEVQTGYGVHWAPSLHDLAYYVRLAEKAGFKVVKRSEAGRTFYLELRKPGAQ